MRPSDCFYETSWNCCQLKDQVLKFIFDVLEKEDYENFDIIK